MISGGETSPQGPSLFDLEGRSHFRWEWTPVPHTSDDDDDDELLSSNNSNHTNAQSKKLVKALINLNWK